MVRCIWIKDPSEIPWWRATKIPVRDRLFKQAGLTLATSYYKNETEDRIVNIVVYFK